MESDMRSNLMCQKCVPTPPQKSKWALLPLVQLSSGMPEGPEKQKQDACKVVEKLGNSIIPKSGNLVKKSVKSGKLLLEIYENVSVT